MKIYMVTGKGGVGKSFFSVALAQALAKSGKKTLLAELGSQSYLQFLFEKAATYAPQTQEKNLDWCLWDSQGCLREFVHHYVKINKVVDLFFENKVMKSLVQAAPGLRELALLGKVTSGVREVGPALNYDAIVVDSFSSGHYLALLEVPSAMAEAVPFGPMGAQSRSMDQVIRNSQVFKTFIVSLYEEMPVKETVELYQSLESRFAGSNEVLLNKKIDIPQEVLSAESAPESFSTYLQAKHRSQEWSLEYLSQHQVPIKLELPYVFENDFKVGFESLRNLIMGGLAI